MKLVVRVKCMTVTYVVKQIHFVFWYLDIPLHSCLVKNLLRWNSMEIAKVKEPI